MRVNLPFPCILHGGDYNPEQFPPGVWDEDAELMQEAGINVATLPVFGWGSLQVDEDTWDFDWLDQVMAKLHAKGIRVVLCTATAATPPWVDAKYPDILRTDISGRKCRHGGRHTFCPHSPNFRRLSTGLARQMAQRYGGHPAVIAWHVSNEYGSPCYCEACAAAFREWLRARYGSLDEVNHRWNTPFWGQRFTDWSQIEPPVHNGQRTFQGLLIDYDRFQSESILDCCRAEIRELKAATPEIPITTNMMGAFKPLDYHAWAKELDIVSWDSYPSWGAKPYEIAFRHSLMRGLKDGQSWMLMEQTPSQQNWQAYNSLKRPGLMRLWSLQAMAHGADTVMYFQWRRSPGGQEMFHGAVVEHAARKEARVFQEVKALGAELASLGQATLGGVVEADAAIVFDWENWWAVEYSSGPSVDVKYVAAVESYFRAFHDLGVTCDVVGVDADLSKYKLVVAPLLKMIKPGFAERVERFVAEGGRFVATCFSGIVDETDRAFPNGYPGPLAKLLGIWVEETDALSPGEVNEALWVEDPSIECACSVLCDIIHLEGAAAVATYGSGFYRGTPVVTRNVFGKGRAYYIGSYLAPDGLRFGLSKIMQTASISPCLVSWPVEGVEITLRNGPGGSLYYVLNHNDEPASISLPSGSFRCLLSGRACKGTLTLKPLDVAILRRD